MPLHLRRRGEIWHARGTVRVGQASVTVSEFSTGARAHNDARAIANAHEAEIRADQIAGHPGRASRLTIDDCLAAYLSRPGGVRRYDQVRCRAISDHVGDRRLADAPAAWGDLLAGLGATWAPATAARWRATFRAALGAGCARHDAGTPPKIPAVQTPARERVVLLTERERAALLAAYSPAAGRVALMLAYQGLRSQEAMRLDWRHVSLRAGTLTVAQSKNGHPRTVPMHPQVLAQLRAMHTAAGGPDRGPVFLSARGEPYADTRAAGTGGNPLTKAHAPACRRAGVTGFTVHDWRHDWATRFLIAGGNTRELMQLGGWRDERMVRRYVTMPGDHLRLALGRVA